MLSLWFRYPYQNYKMVEINVPLVHICLGYLPCVSPWDWTPGLDLHGQAGPQPAGAPHGTTSPPEPAEPLQTVLRTAEPPPVCAVWTWMKTKENKKKTSHFNDLPFNINGWRSCLHLSTLLPQTVSHLSRTSPTRWSSFWVSAGSWALSLIAFPDLTVVS